LHFEKLWNFCTRQKKNTTCILHESFSSILENHLVIVRPDLQCENHLIFTGYGISTLGVCASYNDELPIYQQYHVMCHSDLHILIIFCCFCSMGVCITIVTMEEWHGMHSIGIGQDLPKDPKWVSQFGVE